MPPRRREARSTPRCSARWRRSATTATSTRCWRARGACCVRPIPCGRWRDVTLEDDVLRVPAGVGIDLGGIAKGWTADLAATRGQDAGLPWVSSTPAATCGSSATRRDRRRHRRSGGPAAELGRLSIREGGLATSSIRSRSWGPGLHHVIDPRTGAPAETDLLQVTVTAPTCAEAEVRATAALLAGSAATEQRRWPSPTMGACSSACRSRRRHDLAAHALSRRRGVPDALPRGRLGAPRHHIARHETRLEAILDGVPRLRRERGPRPAGAPSRSGCSSIGSFGSTSSTSWCRSERPIGPSRSRSGSWRCSRP